MSGRYRLYFGGFVLMTILLVVVSLLALWDALSVLTGTVYYGETFVLFAMLGAAAEWIVAGIALGLLAIVFLIATVVSVLRTKSVPRSSRLATLVGRLEREFPMLRRFDVKEKVEPTTEDRAEKLKQRYIDGDISEREFEREMDRLLDDDTSTQRYSRSDGTSIEIDD